MKSSGETRGTGTQFTSTDLEKIHMPYWIEPEYSYSSSFIVAIHPDVNSPYISEFKQKVQLLPK